MEINGSRDWYDSLFFDTCIFIGGYRLSRENRLNLLSIQSGLEKIVASETLSIVQAIES